MSVNPQDTLTKIAEILEDFDVSIEAQHAITSVITKALDKAYIAGCDEMNALMDREAKFAISEAYNDGYDDGYDDGAY